MTIRAVLWDIDDTIFDYGGADHAGMEQHLLAEGLADGFTSDGQALRRWKELTAIHWARFSAGETDWPGQRRDRVRGFIGHALSDAEADDWFGRYLVHYEAAWALFPDVLPALDALGGYRHALLSNSSLTVQRPKLAALGVADRFEAVVCAVELGISKPEAEAFRSACRTLGLPPEQVAYVGDEPDIDARGATDAGLMGIWLDRADTGGRPGLTRVTDLAQLPALLRGDTRFGAPSTFG
ncbi:HAD family hydrolase [Streptomyces yaizuensis]|uniref:HAD family hydrolase n=1 Tax=Streptomyces yaizuensis TaxID=2989713 RepID=A0ABQ5P8P7_9ACTN|nr:HAD family hydrolase [Streptomyces sp. YSPA8]GLF98956.1 HAD family hydrolase [Streptomyces sp. YSPA8]